MYLYFIFSWWWGLAEPLSSTVYFRLLKLIIYAHASYEQALYKPLPKWSAVCRLHVIWNKLLLFYTWTRAICEKGVTRVREGVLKCDLSDGRGVKHERNRIQNEALRNLVGKSVGIDI